MRFSLWDRDVSWLFDQAQEETRRLEPKIRAAISMAWISCCEISRRYFRHQEPPQEALEKAIVRLHQDLVLAPTLPDDTAAEMLVKHYGNYTRRAAARDRNDARRFVVLPEIPDSRDIESVVQVHADLATALESINPDERELVLLHTLYNQSWKQIAEQKGISDVLARQRYCRAMRKLRKQFGSPGASR